jgi:hypothetical protein
MIIVVEHPHSKERRELSTTYIARTYVTLIWPMSGAYDLNLSVNCLTSRNPKVRRRGVCLWRAADIEEVRRQVQAHFRGGDREYETRELMRKHEASKP